jgi:hypothetical protein
VSEITDFRGCKGRYQNQQASQVPVMAANRSAAQFSTLPRLQRRRGGPIGAWLIGSALIALALTFLPIGIGPSSAGVIAPASNSPASFDGTMSNGALKGDRLPQARHDVEKLQSNTPVTIPVGCEAAFSKLVRVGNFTSRCVT